MEDTNQQYREYRCGHAQFGAVGSTDIGFRLNLLPLEV